MSISTLLQFSGGKDSLACLYLYKNKWNKIIIAYVNTGAQYDDTKELVERISKIVPNFIEIKSNQPEQIQEYGYPSDIVPLRNTNIGNLIQGITDIKIQSYFNCCSKNIWEPMLDFVKSNNIRTIIRGQRKSENRKSPIKHGEIIDSVRYLFPIQNWSTQQVFDFLKQENITIPDYYKEEETSHDCWDCTAYLDENKARINNLSHDRKMVVINRLLKIKNAVYDSLNDIHSCTITKQMDQKCQE